MAAEGLAPLVAFREAWYGCLGRRRDALFELAAALTVGARGGAGFGGARWPLGRLLGLA
jgi:hypothetical protein